MDVRSIITFSPLAVLVAFWSAGCVGMAPAPAADRRPAESVDTQLASLEEDVSRRVNAYRSRTGLPALVDDSLMTALARDHSRAMATRRQAFGHDGFSSRGERIHALLGARTVSENVAYNNYPHVQAGERVVLGWIDSPGHHKNLVGSFNTFGTGAARSSNGTWYVTQLYAAVPE